MPAPQHARALTVGLVTGPHARSPRTHSQWVVGPGSPPRGRAVGDERVPDPGRPTPRQEVPPPGALVPPPQRAKPARKSARCGVGDGSPRPHPPRTHSQWVVGPGSPPRVRAAGGGGAPDPGRPTPRQEAPPPGTLMPLPQRAKPARKSARCGVADGSPRPHPPAPTASG